MAQRSKILQRKLDELEQEFEPLLISCLQECAQGRYGLFGQNEHLDPEGRYWNWPDVDRLRLLSSEIRSIRSEFGQPSTIVERYVEFCARRGSNVPGEPRLAAALLEEMGRR